VWPFQSFLIGHSFIGDGSQTISLGLSTLSLGARDFPIAAPNTLSSALMGQNFAFQAIVWDTNINLAEWTNAQEVHL
jgi:hypothetical protein